MRYTNVSVNAFDLYLSARLTTVKRVSRAGRTIARCTALKAAWKITIVASDATTASPTKPSAAVIGSSASVMGTPRRFISLPVTSACSTSVVICV